MSARIETGRTAGLPASAVRVAIALLSSLSLCSPLFAHHTFTEFDQQRTIEVAGTLTEVAWQNPHVRLQVESADSGKVIRWDIECNSVGILGRTKVDPQALKVGAKVKVAGYPSKASPTRLFATNLLTPSAGEFLMTRDAKPRWQSGSVAFEFGAPADATKQPPTKGIFKVWSSALEDPETSPYTLWRGSMSLTPTARQALAAWDPVHDTVARGCNPKGMPTIMEQPYGLEFEDHDATILLRLEEYDTVRTIHMSGDNAAPATKSLLGHSVGKWEGATLVVNTTGISWPYIAPNGLPQGPSSRLEERFTAAQDGRRLTYTLTITDPDTFTKPAILKRAWVWRAGERVRHYGCGTRQNLPQ